MLVIKDTIQAGSLSKTHGYGGHIRMLLKDGVRFKKKFPDFLFLSINNKLVPFHIEESEYIDDKSIMIKIADIDNKEEASKYSGMMFFVKKSDCKTKHDFDPELLLGFHVVDQNNNERGHVKAVLKNPAHYLLELEDDTLLPLHADLIIELNEDKHFLKLEVADGL